MTNNHVTRGNPSFALVFHNVRNSVCVKIQCVEKDIFRGFGQELRVLVSLGFVSAQSTKKFAAPPLHQRKLASIFRVLWQLVHLSSEHGVCTVYSAHLESAGPWGLIHSLLTTRLWRK